MSGHQWWTALRETQTESQTDASLKTYISFLAPGQMPWKCCAVAQQQKKQKRKHKKKK